MLSIETIYEITNGCTSYQGIALKDKFKEYLSSRVRERFYDIKGIESLIEEFKNVPSTGFEEQLLIDIFSTSFSIESWKIGEVLAECYLEDFEKAKIYYTSSRDTKNPKANPQGADIVGFIDVDKGTTIFLFGEVKTSREKRSPPRIMTAKSGMIDELSNIKNDPGLRNALIKWLGFKVKTLGKDDPFKIDYQRALKVYIRERAMNKYFIFGILIRDTNPRDTDLKSTYESLKNNCSIEMGLKLIALYIPIPIEDMKNYIVVNNKGGKDG